MSPANTFGPNDILKSPNRVFESLTNDGFCLVLDVLDNSFIKQIKPALEEAIKIEASDSRHSMSVDHSMVLLCALYGQAFLDLFDIETAMKPFEAVLGDGCIVYAYTSSSMPPKGTNYSHRVHVDCPRVIPNYITNMGGIFLLDDFTSENGATWFLPGSQERTEKPTDEEFYSRAQRLIAPAGSAFYFNTRLWHSGGVNHTSSWRHSLTINMCRPFMKQRMDIPRFLETAKVYPNSPKAQQKLGMWARTPASFEEYYATPEKRTYRQKYE